MFFFALPLACAGPPDSAGADADAATPTVSFVSPADGDTVAAGDLALSIAVGHFVLEDPAKHDDGAAEGYLVVTWTDGSNGDSVQTGSTTPTIPIATAGAWTLTADLRFADGDELSERFDDFAPASIAIAVQ